MAEVTISGMIEGGKATGGAPLGPALGPLGVNINAIVTEINNKTAQFDGLKILVKVIINPETKAFRIDVGAPSTSALILKEIGVQAGAKVKDEVIGNITLEQVKKIAESKGEKIYGKTLADKVKQILGTCNSMGVKCDNDLPKNVIKRINSGEIKV